MELNRLVLSLLATQRTEIHNPKMIIILSRTGAAAAAAKCPSVPARQIKVLQGN